MGEQLPRLDNTAPSQKSTERPELSEPSRHDPRPSLSLIGGRARGRLPGSRLFDVGDSVATGEEPESQEKVVADGPCGNLLVELSSQSEDLADSAYARGEARLMAAYERFIPPVQIGPVRDLPVFCQDPF